MPTKLGQNFLKDEQVLQKIMDSALLSVKDTVLEIGPGKGALTEKLVKNAKKVIAIEVDDQLIPILKSKFKETKNLEIIHKNVLDINLSDLITSYELSPRSGIPHAGQVTSYKLVANIPYYITSPIIRLFLENTYQPQEMILMVQKEVAERIVAKPGQMSILAVSVQYYAHAKILFNVPASAFDPMPEVDSAVIRITPTRKPNKDEDKAFFRVVKAGFSSKRKTLVNNLASSFHLEKASVSKKLETLGFSSTVRAQELGIEDWKKLATSL